MIRRDQIPDESFDAAMAVAVKDGLRAAIAAALNAWPGVREARNGSSVSLNPHIILPLPQEVSDE